MSDLSACHTRSNRPSGKIFGFKSGHCRSSIVGQLRLPQLLQALVAAAEMFRFSRGKCLKPLVSGLQRAIVQKAVWASWAALPQAGGPRWNRCCPDLRSNR